LCCRAAFELAVHRQDVEVEARRVAVHQELGCCQLMTDDAPSASRVQGMRRAPLPLGPVRIGVQRLLDRLVARTFVRKSWHEFVTRTRECIGCA
jgi:hypothetical protein